jgi:hypothetical protein
MICVLEFMLRNIIQLQTILYFDIVTVCFFWHHFCFTWVSGQKSVSPLSTIFPFQFLTGPFLLSYVFQYFPNAIVYNTTGYVSVMLNVFPAYWSKHFYSVML